MSASDEAVTLLEQIGRNWQIITALVAFVVGYTKLGSRVERTDEKLQDHVRDTDRRLKEHVEASKEHETEFEEQMGLRVTNTEVRVTKLEETIQRQLTNVQEELQSVKLCLTSIDTSMKVRAEYEAQGAARRPRKRT